MVDELSHDHRIGERKQNLHDSPDGNVDIILHADERRLLSVHLDNLEIDLVDVKRVHFVGRISNGPHSC